MNNCTDILLFNRSFWPDIEATGQFLTELCEELVKRYTVTVIAGRSYYLEMEPFGIGRFYKAEVFNRINIIRVRHTRFWKLNLIGRVINWLTYSVLAFVTSLRIKPKIIIVCTDPPFLGIIGMVISRLKAAPFIYNCRDLFPDVAWGLGRLNKDNVMGRLFDWFNKRAFDSASLVVCLGLSMEGKLRQKTRARVKVITDWADTFKIKPIPRGENPLLEKFRIRNKFIIMHSGNIGLSQDFRSIIQAMGMLDDKVPLCLVFVGEGSAKKTLQHEIKLTGLENILFLPYQPMDTLSLSLCMADLHLITLKNGMAGAVVPSKVYGIMAAGRPYLAVTDEESEPAHIAEEFRCGLWALPGNPQLIAKKIEWAISHPNELGDMGKAARGAAEIRFDKTVVINQWFDILEKVEAMWYA